MCWLCALCIVCQIISLLSLFNLLNSSLSLNNYNCLFSRKISMHNIYYSNFFAWVVLQQFDLGEIESSPFLSEQQQEQKRGTKQERGCVCKLLNLEKGLRKFYPTRDGLAKNLCSQLPFQPQSAKESRSVKIPFSSQNKSKVP